MATHKRVFKCDAPGCRNTLDWTLSHQPTDKGLCKKHLKELCDEQDIPFTHFNGKVVR